MCKSSRHISWNPWWMGDDSLKNSISYLSKVKLYLHLSVLEMLILLTVEKY